MYKLVYNLIVDFYLDSAITGLCPHYFYSFCHSVQIVERNVLDYELCQKGYPEQTLTPLSFYKFKGRTNGHRETHQKFRNYNQIMEVSG